MALSTKVLSLSQEINYFYPIAFGPFSISFRAFLRRFSQNCEKRLSASSCLSVCPSSTNNSIFTARTFIFYIIFRKSVENIRVSLKSGKNNGYFTRRPIYIQYNISLHSSQNEKCFRKKVLDKIKTHILCSVTFFFFRKSHRL